jgi:hypothetical protein
MMYRYIWGTGTMAKGSDEPFSERSSMLEQLPIRDYTDPRSSRRFGRLTKMIFIAAHRALLDAGIEDFSSIPAAVATCIGETKAALTLLEQIHKTRGASVSPAAVPNSVHNAAAGYLSIGLKNHAPSVTVSQGRLSAEAALASADDFLEAGLFDRVLVSAGDESEPAWAERLSLLGDPTSARRLENEAFEEGAAALVLGVRPGPRPLGAITAGTERWDGTAQGLRKLFSRRDIRLCSSVEIHTRKSGGGENLAPICAEALDTPLAQIVFNANGPGTVQTGPLSQVIAAARNGRTADLLFAAMEADELAYVHWKPSPLNQS